MKSLMCLHNLIISTKMLIVVTFSITVLTVHAELHHKTLTVDATDRESWVYVNLLEGEIVDIKDAATSLEWDLGFQRTDVITNGGAPTVLANQQHWFWRTLILKISLKHQMGITSKTPNKLLQLPVVMDGTPILDHQIIGFCQMQEFTSCGLQLVISQNFIL